MKEQKYFACLELLHQLSNSMLIPLRVEFYPRSISLYTETESTGAYMDDALGFIERIAFELKKEGFPFEPLFRNMGGKQKIDRLSINFDHILTLKEKSDSDKAVKIDLLHQLPDEVLIPIRVEFGPNAFYVSSPAAHGSHEEKLALDVLEGLQKTLHDGGITHGTRDCTLDEGSKVDCIAIKYAEK